MIQSLIAQGSDVTIRAACAAFGVSESGFYAHRHKAQRLRRQQDRQIVHQMKQIFEESYHCYGSPRLVKALKIRGFDCGKTRVRRLMMQEAICPKQKRRFRPRVPPKVIRTHPMRQMWSQRCHQPHLPQSVSIATSHTSRLKKAFFTWQRPLMPSPDAVLVGAPETTWKLNWSRMLLSWPLKQERTRKPEDNRNVSTIRIEVANTPARAFDFCWIMSKS